MKILLVVLITGLFYCSAANAQAPARLPIGNIKPRSIRFNFITRDSVNLALNEEYYMIEDSCAQVIRYAHLNMQTRKFFGKVKDVSKLDPSLVLTEGNYTAEGLKDGYFTTHYLNGKLEAKGNFKSNQYDGKWEIYYDDGKPKMFFEANGPIIKITDVWDAKGIKTVDNGKGAYRAELGALYWKGKLLNGRPDGSWSLMKTNDPTNNAEIGSEKFKDGAFQKGTGPIGTYTDVSRMVLVSTEMLPFTHVESLRISMVPCGGVSRKNIVNAIYKNGTADFLERMKDVISRYLGTVNIQSYDDQLLLEGEVNTQGNIVNLIARSPFDDKISLGLILALGRLPALQPATVDGKPVLQKINISFKFTRGIYSFNYRLLPVEVK